MQIPTSTVRDIAGQLPTLGAYPGVGPQLLTPWLNLPDPMLQRTAAAAMSLQEVFYRAGSDRYSRAPAILDSTFGFIAVDDSVAHAILHVNPQYPFLDGGFTFGVAVLMPSGDWEGRQRLLRMIPVAGVQFPVVEITGTIMRNSIPPSPNHQHNAGTSSCWAKNRQTNNTWTDGILTAGHVLDKVALGSSIPMLASSRHQRPTSATFVDLGQQPIDGAVLKIARTPAGLNPLTVNDPATLPIAPGTLMQLDGRHTSGSGTVLRVNQNPGYFGPLLAERIVHDVTGIAGDSGGLVTDNNLTDGLGLHIGTIPSKSGASRDSVAQGMWQVTQWFDADVLI